MASRLEHLNREKETYLQNIPLTGLDCSNSAAKQSFDTSHSHTALGMLSANKKKHKDLFSFLSRLIKGKTLSVGLIVQLHFSISTELSSLEMVENCG